MSRLPRLADLTRADRAALSDRLDRFTARLAYAAIGATALLFAFHAVRHVARMLAA